MHPSSGRAGDKAWKAGPIPSWSLVLQQKRQLLQGQAHPELLLRHQVQDLLHLFGEVLHGIQVQRLGKESHASQPALPVAVWTWQCLGTGFQKDMELTKLGLKVSGPERGLLSLKWGWAWWTGQSPHAT